MQTAGQVTVGVMLHRENEMSGCIPGAHQEPVYLKHFEEKQSRHGAREKRLQGPRLLRLLLVAVVQAPRRARQGEQPAAPLTLPSQALVPPLPSLLLTRP